MPKSKQPQILKFIGQRGPDGKPVEYVGWAPARDLTQEDLDLIGPEMIEALIASNLYAWDSGSPSIISSFAIEEEMGEE